MNRGSLSAPRQSKPRCHFCIPGGDRGLNVLRLVLEDTCEGDKDEGGCLAVVYICGVLRDEGCTRSQAMEMSLHGDVRSLCWVIVGISLVEVRGW